MRTIIIMLFAISCSTNRHYQDRFDSTPTVFQDQQAYTCPAGHSYNYRIQQCVHSPIATPVAKVIATPIAKTIAKHKKALKKRLQCKELLIQLNQCS